MINKQNLWFLTLFSLILVLSVYYITMPNDLLIASNNAESKTNMTNEDDTTYEKNNAYEQLKYLSIIEGEEEKLEKLIKKEYNLNSFVKIDNNTITVVAAKKKHDVTLANNIMRSIQAEFDTKQ